MSDDKHEADHDRNPSSQTEPSVHSAGDTRPPRLDTSIIHAVRVEEDAHVGVKKVEAAEKVYGRYSKWVLFASIGLASYIYSLDGTTTSYYLTFAASGFGEHSLIASIQVAQSIIIAVGKPVIAKVADVSSRGTAYLGVLIFYVVGYIVIASAQNIGTIAGGIVIYAVGYTGLQLLTQIIIADITTLKWRGLVSSLVSAPFLINAFVGSNIASAVLGGGGWRWGYGMFAILVPAALAPLIITLLWAEAKAKRLGIIPPTSSSTSASRAHTRASSNASPLSPLGTRSPSKGRAGAGAGVWGKVRRVGEQLDVIGLLLLGASVALILLPLTLSQTAKGRWGNPSIIAMLVVGLVLLPVFVLWELRFASRPVIAPRFMVNRAVVGASIIGFFDFVSFYLTFTYLYSFVLVVKPWSLVNATYFVSTQTVALTFFGILTGLGMRLLHRYKPLLILGLSIRLLGVGLMIHSRGANASTVELVWTQVLQGMGGGIAAVASQVGAQASVVHADVGMVTAIVLLITEIGGAVGGAIAGAIWANTMPGKLEKYLPGVSAEQRALLYGSITTVRAQPRGDPTREGVISAYDDTMKIMVIAATCVSVVPILVSLIMPNWYLGDKQNAVDTADLTGEREVDLEDDDFDDDGEGDRRR